MYSHRLMNELYKRINDLSPTDCRRLNSIISTENIVHPDDVLFPIVRLYTRLPWKMNKHIIKEYVSELVFSHGPDV